MRAVGVLCARNEELYITSALRDLIAEGLDVVLIDHDSDDRTVALAAPFLEHGLLAIERLPWNGSFSVTEQLRAKQRVIDQVDHDWIVHVDADEWPMSPVPGQTLLDGLRAADAAGYNAVHFDEFTFVPERGVDLTGTDYRRLSTRYYHFRRAYPHLQRAWKHRSGLDNTQLGGHLLQGPVRQAPRDFVMRHYIVLSEEQARRKYLDRRFADDEVAHGFHFDRIGLTPNDLRFPKRDAYGMKTLPDWSSKAFDRSEPVREHYWQWANARRKSGSIAS